VVRRIFSNILLVLGLKKVEKHCPSIITAAATCFDELILDTEMYEQSCGVRACACASSRVKVADPDSATVVGQVNVNCEDRTKTNTTFVQYVEISVSRLLALLLRSTRPSFI
jgi:hypothetical protein